MCCLQLTRALGRPYCCTQALCSGSSQVTNDRDLIQYIRFLTLRPTVNRQHINMSDQEQHTRGIAPGGCTLRDVYRCTTLQNVTTARRRIIRGRGEKRGRAMPYQLMTRVGGELLFSSTHVARRKPISANENVCPVSWLPSHCPL